MTPARDQAVPVPHLNAWPPTSDDESAWRVCFAGAVFVPLRPITCPQSPHSQPPDPQSSRCARFSHCGIGRTAQGLAFWAELAGLQPHSRASGHNQRLWELGDCFEVFLGESLTSPYIEVHLAPGGWTLQLRWSSRGNKPADGEDEVDLDSHLVTDLILRSFTSCRPEAQRWCAGVEIPWSAFVPAGAQECLFSLSRYEADVRDERGEPTLYSSSPHAAEEGGWPSFHDRCAWRTLRWGEPVQP
jgi:hypothetical protein